MSESKAGSEDIFGPVQLRFRVTYARVLDANRKFVEAAVRYYGLSTTTGYNVRICSVTIGFVLHVSDVCTVRTVLAGAARGPPGVTGQGGHLRHSGQVGPAAQSSASVARQSKATSLPINNHLYCTAVRTVLC